MGSGLPAAAAVALNTFDGMDPAIDSALSSLFKKTAIVPSVSGDLSCPICNGTFVEELESDPPNPNPASAPASTPASFNMTDIANALGISPPRTSGNSSSSPVAFLHEYLTGLVNYNNNTQIVFENVAGAGGGGGGGGDPPASPFSFGSLSDHMSRPGPEHVIQEPELNLDDNFLKPPASQSAIDSLRGVEITDSTAEREKEEEFLVK